MDSFDKIPEKVIEPGGLISNQFLTLGIKSFKDACVYVHNFPYGYNSNYDDPLILFKENKGTCTSKHAVIAELAHELRLEVFKFVGIYKFTEEITTGAGDICTKYNLPYIPLLHCFLKYNTFYFDLTDGNRNGKKKSLSEFLFTEKVKPFISKNEEYLLYRKALKQNIMLRDEMLGINEIQILKAREEALILLKKAVQ